MIEFGPGDTAYAAGLPGRTPVEARLLGADHPFLRHGRWRGVAAGDPGERPTSIVASVDPRQRTDGGPVGCLGFAMVAPVGAGDGQAGPGDDPVGPAAREVLAAALDWLQDQGVAVIRAPVQLATWYGHRAVTGGFPDEGGLPPFPFEPRADRGLLALLERGGFVPAHHAVSFLVDSRAVVARAAPSIARAGASGLRDRAIRLDDLDTELDLLRRLSAAAFRGTWGLGEIDREEFASLYRPLAGAVDPGLIRILEEPDGRAIGFVLGLGGPIASAFAPPGGPAFVLKTIAVTPEARRRHPGVGVALTAIVHRAALERGYAAGVHAMMAIGSNAHRLSRRWGYEVRTYATFERAAP
jgi:ribosomal protein S18 acetylase RimI-like enzyme